MARKRQDSGGGGGGDVEGSCARMERAGVTREAMTRHWGNLASWKMTRRGERIPRNREMTREMYTTTKRDSSKKRLNRISSGLGIEVGKSWWVMEMYWIERITTKSSSAWV